MKRQAPGVISLSVILLFAITTYAQTEELPKFEVGAEFTSLGRKDFGGRGADPGVGGRFTFNFNENVAVEAAGYLFPQRCFSCERNGYMSQAVFGVKAGKRFQKWGIFGKARPGFVRFSDGSFNILPTGGGGTFPFRIDLRPSTHVAVDLGAVLEFYPMRRIVTRFDAGDTLVHFASRTSNSLISDPTTGVITLVPFTSPARTRHNFQFTAGVGFRF